MSETVKKTSGKKAWKIIGIIIAAILIVALICAFTGLLGATANTKRAEAADFVGSRLIPEVDKETGYWTFTTDDDFRILQLTDLHIGGGFLSIRKDSWALNAVAELIQRVKPDLVIVTGDIAYPVPFQSGTFDNLRESKMFAALMESLGVYWTVTFGNHDSEVYSMFSLEYIAEFYEESDFKYCLFQRGPSNIDGEGNYIINIKNTAGKITQSLVMFDSHAYVDGSLTNEYDSIHENQIQWYVKEITELNKKNGSPVKSMAFFHIPLNEYADAWEEYRLNGKKDTENVKFIYGVAGEPDEKVWPGKYRDNLFETMLELGSTQAIFCGHDHLNNFSVEYKGIRLTYGLSIDYLAYWGIVKQTAQRGGTVITVSPDGSFTCAPERLVK